MYKLYQKKSKKEKIIKKKLYEYAKTEYEKKYICIRKLYIV